MLGWIPLRSARGIVSHGYGQGEGVGQLPLNFSFPGITTATIAAADIGKELATGVNRDNGCNLPAATNRRCMSGKGGSVVGNADHRSSTIFRNIVNPIG